MERAAGNPLFLRELASMGEKTADAEDLPDTVETLVATRIDQLAPGDRALLRWASVLGVSFSGALIIDVLEDDPTVAAASEAWDRLGEFVERDPDVPGAFRFRHALIRDAAYEGLSYKRRRELHGRVAEVIEGNQGDRPEEAAELLSLHYFYAGRSPEAWKSRASLAISRGTSMRTSTRHGSTSGRSRRARTSSPWTKPRSRTPGARWAKFATPRVTTTEPCTR